MWDGKWNAGGGVHDPNATSWVDLVAGIELEAQYSPVTSNDDSISVRGKWVTGNSAAITYLQSSFFDPPKISGGGFTVEIASKIDLSGDHNIFGQRYVALNLFTYDNKICGWLGNGNNTTSNLSIGQKGTVAFIVVNNGSSYDQMSYTNGGSAIQYQNRAYQGSLNELGQFGVGQGQYDAWGVAEGDYYCIRLYNRALTAAEIAANYAVDKVRFGLS